MRDTVDQQGLAGFAAAVTANSWEAPVIPSAWHIAHIAAAGDQAYLSLSRDFGSALLTAIDETAPSMRVDPADDTLATATTLIDVAQWLGRTEGYGNLLLARRARDVALTGLARRVADLTASLAATQAQMARCRATFDAAPTRARVLNFEAGAPLFPVDSAATDQALLDVWTRRELRRHVTEFNAFPTPDPGAGGDQGRADVARINELTAGLGITPGAAETTDAFFIDDEVGDSPTTRATWNKKRHQQLLGDTVPQNLESVETLVQFRAAVGAFPLQPAERSESFSPPGEEAFADAWEPYIGDATFNLGRGAWAVYDRITSGHFLDYDSAMEVRAAARTAAQSTPTVGVTSTPATTPSATP